MKKKLIKYQIEKKLFSVKMRKKLPIIFQLTKVDQIISDQFAEIKTNNQSIKVNKLQTDNLYPNLFYKPISKIWIKK